MPSGETLLRELVTHLIAAPGPMLEEVSMVILGDLGLEVVTSSQPAGHRNVVLPRVDDGAIHGVGCRGGNEYS